MPIVYCQGCHGKGGNCQYCGGSGLLNAPGAPNFVKHFWENGTYVGRYNGQDYFRSDGTPMGVGPGDGRPRGRSQDADESRSSGERKKFDPRDWQ